MKRDVIWRACRSVVGGRPAMMISVALEDGVVALVGLGRTLATSTQNRAYRS